ncbi:MAG: hypothetical protein LBC86_10215 [Oscillospiraceae bacterium]|jgi:hypothetical protein|nr:hypothetical protein [Oscillospiraceae bacterium]
MNKREQREEQRKIDEERRRKQIARNWMIGGVSLVLAILFYSFGDTIFNFS